MSEQNTNETSADLAGKTIVCSLTIRRPGNTRRVKGHQITNNPDLDAPIRTESDPEAINVTKELLRSPELQAVRAFDQRLKKYLMSRCVPSHMKRGMYLLPTVLVAEVDDKLQELATERAALVEKFIAVYKQQKEAQRDVLNTLYREADYAHPDHMRGAFSLEYTYLTLGVPGQLRKIRAEIFHREEEKARRTMQDAAEEIRQALRQAMCELTDRMIHCLGYEADGKRVKFTDSVSEDVRDFLDTFAKRNLTEDAELDSLVEQAKQVLNGVTDDQMRTENDTRDHIREAFEMLQNTLADNMQVEPKRKLTLKRKAKSVETDEAQAA